MTEKKAKLSRRAKKLKPTKRTQGMAMYIAMVVRNSMETFHFKYLSDKQMKELNPIIRNAICTALYASEIYDESIGAKTFVDFHVRSIPKYWEEPELTKSFIGSVEYYEAGTDEERIKIIGAP